MPGEFADLFQLGAGGLRGAAFGASTRAFPLQRHLGRNKSLHGVSHVGQPRSAAQLAVGKDIQPDGALLFERGQDGAIFNAAQFFQGDLTGGVGGAGFEQLRRTQQATHLFGAKTVRHLGLID